MATGAHGLTVGFPRMHKEAGERRDHLPDVVAAVAGSVDRVIVEAGIGGGMELSDLDYTLRHERISVGTNEDAFAQDIVVTLRSPETSEFVKLRPGATLIAMLHYPTRPARVAALAERGIEAVSLDGIVDDAGRRLVVNAGAVAWNGLEAAFDVLDRTWPPLRSHDRGPILVTVLGAGAIGRHAVEASSKVGSRARQEAFLAARLPGVVTRTVGRNVTADVDLMQRLLAETDVLVDASQRDDTARPLVPNPWIGWLPAHAVICDCVVDPYLLDEIPPTVRSVEGIRAETSTATCSSRGSRLVRHDPRRGAHRGAAPRRVLLLVARRPPAGVHGAVREAAGSTSAGPRPAAWRGGAARERGLPRARPRAGTAHHLALSRIPVGARSTGSARVAGAVVRCRA